jgi:hypothetical protein
MCLLVILTSKSLPRRTELIAKVRNISQMATPIVYVAIKLRNKSKSLPPADGGEGGKKL